MLEYVLSFAALLAVVAILAGLISVTIRYSERAENLAGSEYP